MSTIGEYDWYKLDRKGKKILEEVGQGKRWFIKDEVSAAVCGALTYINILKGEIDASSKNNSVFADKYKRLERELTEAKSLNKSLTQQVTDCEHKCLKLQDEYHEAIESHAGVRKNLTEEVDELKLQLRTSGEETIAFAKLLQETAKECNQAKAALNKFHDMQAEVDNLKDVNRILEQQKQDLLKTNQELWQQNMKLRSDLRAAQGVLRKVSVDTHNMVNRIIAKEIENEKANERLDISENSVQTSQSQEGVGSSSGTAELP